MDAWGELSADIASVATMEAFIHGVTDKEAAFITMSWKPKTLDEALALQEQVIHDKRSLTGLGKSCTKSAQSVSFEYPESQEPSIQNAAAVARDTNPSVVKLQEELKDLKSSMSQMLTLLGKSTALQAAPTSPSTLPSPKRASFTSNMICHNCKGKGHGYQDCPSPCNPDFMTPPQLLRSPVRPPTPTATPLNS